jgi:hypothetical protein
MASLVLGVGTVAVTVLPAQVAGAIPTKTFYVNSSADTGSDSGCASPTNTTCGIDDAITAFNADTTADDADTVVFSSSVPTFTVGNPTAINNATSGITLAIDGNGPTATAVSGNNSNEVFAIDGSITVTLTGLTIEDGSAANGGAIYNDGTLSITNSTLSGNTATTPGCTGQNGCEPLGGAIFNNQGTVKISDSTLSGNTATTPGCTEPGPDAVCDPAGGAVYDFFGSVTITNSTLSGNTATTPICTGGCSPSGGGIENNSRSVTITNSTLSGNTATTPACTSTCTTMGDSVFNDGGTTTMGRTIVSNGGASDNCGADGGGTLPDLGYNLEDDAAASCGFSSTDNDVVGESPDLGPLQDNGGPTETQAIPSTSPAASLVATGCPSTDQRGDLRPSTNCSAGAYQVNGAFPSSSTFSQLGYAADAGTVPASICFVTITASGGQGGDATDGTPGGDAASVTATVPVTPGSALDVEVGGAGASEPAGGAGAVGGGGGGNTAGGGGGASAVSTSGTPLVVAGGGGGASDGGGQYSGDSPGGSAGTLGNPGATGSAVPGMEGGSFSTGGSGGSSSGDGGSGGAGLGGGGGGVAINGGGASSPGGPGGDGNGSVGGGGGGAGDAYRSSDRGGGGGDGGAATQTGSSGPGDPNGGVGDDNGGNGGGSFDGLSGGGGGGVGFGGGGGGFNLDGGGGAGYGGGGGGYGPSAGGGGGSSYVTPSVIGTPTSSDASTGDGQVTISYDPAADRCTTTSTTMVEVTPSGATAVVGNGSSLTDFLTVTGTSGGPTPTNTAGGVDFYVCHVSTSSTFTPGLCPSTGTPYDATEILSGTGDKGYAQSTFLPTGAGTWCFSTTYGGDSNYAGSSDNTTIADSNECALVSPASPTIVTTPSAASVTLTATPPTLTDTAVLSGGYVPTGTITFTLYNPGGTLVATRTVTVSGNGSYTTSPGYTLPSTGTDTGTYQWDASYTSGTVNNKNASENNAVAEQVKVVSPCGSLTAYFLSATSATGNFTGLFCVNAAGTGTYTQYSVPAGIQTATGTGMVKVVGGTTALSASGTKLALLGEKTSTIDTFTETAPVPMKTGTFTLSLLP